MNNAWSQLTEHERLILSVLHRHNARPRREGMRCTRVLGYAARELGELDREAQTRLSSECYELPPLLEELDNTLLGLVHQRHNGALLVKGSGNFGIPENNFRSAHPIFRECALTAEGQLLLLREAPELWVLWENSDHVRALSTCVKAMGRRKARLIACAACRQLGEHTLSGAALDALAEIESFADSAKINKVLTSAMASIRTESISGSRRLPHPVHDAANDRKHGRVIATVGRILVYRGESVENVQKLLHGLFCDVAAPCPPVEFDYMWKTNNVVELAASMYRSRDFGAMPILGDALMDAGCDSEVILDHCRNGAAHFRGCWLVDLILEIAQ